MIKTIRRNLRRAKFKAPSPPRIGRGRRGARQCAVFALAAALLAACSEKAPPVGTVGHLTAYFGGAAAEEPRAALVARDVLSAGGSAADAATAMYFTMAVTLPSAAGLAGGGVCLYYDHPSNKAEALDFLPGAPALPAADGQWAATVPGTVRGMFALHARYGLLPWERLVLPAESMARFGIPAPRALVRTLPGAPVLQDPVARAQFGGRDGTGLLESDTLQRIDLAATLGRLRAAGPGDLYTGALARAYVDGVRAIGGSVSIEDMRAYRATWREPVGGRLGAHRVHFAPSPATGGQIAADLWARYGENSTFAGMDDGARERLLVDAARSAYAGSSRPVPEDTTAGFLVMDRAGSAAACTLTMNRKFGTGRIVPGLGMIAAPAVRGPSPVHLGLAPMLIANHNTSTTYLAATGAGDGYAPVALLTAAFDVTARKASVERALAAPRAAPGPSSAVVERDAPAAVKAAFSGAADVPAIGRVLLMHCPDGMISGWETCTVGADPRGHGLAINAER